MGIPPREWQVAADYFRNCGFPERLIDNGCLAYYEAERIINLLLVRRPAKILEIGTYIGLSGTVLSLASPPEAKVYSVDPNFPLNLQSAKYGWTEPRSCLDYARDVMSHARCLHKVQLCEGFFSCLPADEHAERLKVSKIELGQRSVIGWQVIENGPFDFAFIDGDHDADAVYSDLRLVSQNLTDGAMIVMHDMRGGAGQTVRRGLYRFLAENPGFILNIDDNLGYLTFCN